MPSVSDLKITLFADGANLKSILELARNPLIRGFTTNPSLMRQAGVRDYEAFAREVLQAVPEYPVSFEVISDDIDEMERQARKLASWGKNVFVKVPVSNTSGKSTCPLVARLAKSGIQVNVTAILTLKQSLDVMAVLKSGPPAFVSIFAGRIADAGVDPATIVAPAVQQAPANVQLIWASPREIFNIFQADAVGCHVITVSPDILRKLPLVGRDLDEYSLDTVKLFYQDARQAGYKL